MNNTLSLLSFKFKRLAIKIYHQKNWSSSDTTNLLTPRPLMIRGIRTVLALDYTHVLSTLSLNVKAINILWEAIYKNPFKYARPWLPSKQGQSNKCSCHVLSLRQHVLILNFSEARHLITNIKHCWWRTRSEQHSLVQVFRPIQYCREFDNYICT